MKVSISLERDESNHLCCIDTVTVLVPGTDTDTGSKRCKIVVLHGWRAHDTMKETKKQREKQRKQRKLQRENQFSNRVSEFSLND